VQAFTAALMAAGTIASLSVAAALDAGSGATFALVARRARPNRVDSVTGLVGAAGGLGGFVPPLIMGALYGAYHSYPIGPPALAVVAAAHPAVSNTSADSASCCPSGPLTTHCRVPSVCCIAVMVSAGIVAGRPARMRQGRRSRVLISAMNRLA
jgi:hypothetical protein